MRSISDPFTDRKQFFTNFVNPGIVYINVDADFYSYKSGAAWFRSRLGIEDGMCGSVHDIFPPGMQVVLILDQFDTASHGVDVDPQYRKNFLVSLMGEAANFGNLRVFVATKDEEFANETHCYNGGTKFMKLELPPATQWTDSMLLNYASELVRPWFALTRCLRSDSHIFLCVGPVERCETDFETEGRCQQSHFVVRSSPFHGA